jgi:rubrerythrin
MKIKGVYIVCEYCGLTFKVCSRHSAVEECPNCGEKKLKQVRSDFEGE